MRLCFLFCLFFTALPIASAQAHIETDSFADLAEQLMPAVVNISISTRLESGSSRVFPPENPLQEFFEDFMERHGERPDNDDREPPDNAPGPKISSLGSGFVIDPEGIVITNNHVVAKADEITVIFTNGDKYEATLIGRDAKTDLAVLKIASDKPFPYVKFGDNRKMRVGDWVIAIGNPFGLGGSLSAGVISAINRNINAGPYDSFIQSDAAINKGNSGGPLFNLKGEVIGVNTAIISPTGGSVGIGFSIPADLAMNVIAQLREFGETRRGWLGVRIQVVTDELAESLSLEKAHGALISEIAENGPAEKAGLKQGDVIIRFDGKMIEEMHDLPRIVAETPIEKKVTVEVIRQGRNVKKSVVIGRLEEAEKDGRLQSFGRTPQPSEEDETQILGMTLTPLDAKWRRTLGLSSDDKGVVITHIRSDSPAAEAGLRPRDVIVEIDQSALTRPADIIKRVEAARKAGKKSVLVLVRTRAGLRFIALQIEDTRAD